MPWVLKTVGKFLPHLLPHFSRAAAAWQIVYCLADSIAVYLTVLVLLHAK